MKAVGRFKRVVDNTLKNEFEHSHYREELIKRINNLLDQKVEVWTADLHQVDQYEEDLRNLFNSFMNEFTETLEFPETFEVDQNKYESKVAKIVIDQLSSK